MPLVRECQAEYFDDCRNPCPATQTGPTKAVTKIHGQSFAPSLGDGDADGLVAAGVGVAMNCFAGEAAGLPSQCWALFSHAPRKADGAPESVEGVHRGDGDRSVDQIR